MEPQVLYQLSSAEEPPGLVADTHPQGRTIREERFERFWFEDFRNVECGLRGGGEEVDAALIYTRA